MTDQQSNAEASVEAPRVKSRAGVRRAVHPAHGDPWGECKRCEIEFDDLDELDEHMAAEHPRQCSRCRRMAAYTTAPGSRLSGASYCVEHAPSEGPWTAYIWILEPANDEAPRKPDDHPLEQALRGLYGSREEAQEAGYSGA